MKRLTRRKALEVLGSAGVAMVAACSSSPTTPSSTTSQDTSTATPGATIASKCVTTPSETAGPYPDRTGMFNNPGFYRSDITEGIAMLHCGPDRLTILGMVIDMAAVMTLVDMGNGARATIEQQISWIVPQPALWN